MKIMKDDNIIILITNGKDYEQDLFDEIVSFFQRKYKKLIDDKTLKCCSNRNLFMISKAHHLKNL